MDCGLGTCDRTKTSPNLSNNDERDVATKMYFSFGIGEPKGRGVGPLSTNLINVVFWRKMSQVL